MSDRGRSTQALWWLTWLALAVLIACESLDAWQRAAPAFVWLVKLGPILILLPGVGRDRLRALVWVSFVALLYFLLAVQRLFAEPDSPRALVELLAVITVFFSSMFYVRWRARELRARGAEESL